MSHLTGYSNKNKLDNLNPINIASYLDLLCESHQFFSP